MTKQAVTVDNPLTKTPFQRFCVNFKKNWQLHLMMLLPFIYFIIFEFGPMYGLQIAFRDYRPRAGIWESKWVGLDKFDEFFRNRKWTEYMRNTITISLYSICVGFPVPIVFALILHINEHNVLKKITQNVSYLPHFISTVVLVGIMNQVFNPLGGIYGNVMRALGASGEIYDFRYSPGAFYHLYQWSGTWQGMGWSAIMYVAALAGVSPELHEAAKIDGATRLQRVWNVDIPAILPTICIMLILRFGSIISVGHEKAYLMQHENNLERSEIISTYTYKHGIGASKMSFGTAVGLMNSIINTILIIAVNAITDRLSDGENSLF